MTRRFGLILAGGAGLRLGGVRKAELKIGGSRLLERVARVFAGQVAELFVASGQGAVSGLGHTSLLDETNVPMGPLAGLKAAMRHLKQGTAPDDMVITVAVDTPFLPPDYVERLTNTLAKTGAAFAAWGENIYPTNSAWRFADLCDALETAGESVGPKAILSKAGAARVDWSDTSPDDPFANTNTLADLIALQRRALRADR